MKPNIIQIGFATFEEFKARTMAIARGELRPAVDDPKVWFPSIDSLGRVLSAKNRDLLTTISETPLI
jgi:predicted transcriptional regulator